MEKLIEQATANWETLNKGERALARQGLHYAKWKNNRALRAAFAGWFVRRRFFRVLWAFRRDNKRDIPYLLFRNYCVHNQPPFVGANKEKAPLIT